MRGFVHGVAGWADTDVAAEGVPALAAAADVGDLSALVNVLQDDGHLIGAEARPARTQLLVVACNTTLSLIDTQHLIISQY